MPILYASSAVILVFSNAIKRSFLKRSFLTGMTMQTPRRFLPSTPPLAAFEAAAGSGSATLCTRTPVHATDCRRRSLCARNSRGSVRTVQPSLQSQGRHAQSRNLANVRHALLAPLIRKFLAQNPGTTVNLRRLTYFDFRIKVLPRRRTAPWDRRRSQSRS